MNLIDSLNAVLKYAHETTQNLLEQLESDAAHREPHSHLRLVAADSLQEDGREPEANLLRSGHPIYFHQGKVHHAKGRFMGSGSFLRGYHDAAFFSSTDHEAGEPLDENFGLSDLTPQTSKEMRQDALHFYHSHADMIPTGEEESAGHNFWYSRNGHGTGFFDHEDLFGDHADALHDAASRAGEYHLDVSRPEEGQEGEPVIEGYGGRSGWGQPAGLHE